LFPHAFVVESSQPAVACLVVCIVVLFTFAGDTWRTDLMFVIGRYRQLFCKTKKCGTTAFPFLVSPIFSPVPLCSFLPSAFSLNPVRECVEIAISPPSGIQDSGARHDHKCVQKPRLNATFWLFVFMQQLAFYIYVAS